MSTLSAEASQEGALLADLLLNPARSYVLEAPPGCERYALLGSWEGPTLRWSEVTWRPEAALSSRLEIGLHPLPAEAPGLADGLREIYEMVDPQHAPERDFERSSLDRALWVGGSTGEARDPRWELHVTAALGSRGLDAEIFSRPGDGPVTEVIKRLEKFRGRATILWRARSGDRDRRAEIEKRAKPPLILLEEQDFDVALVEAVLALDQADQERAEEEGRVEGEAEQDAPLSGGPFYFKKTGRGGGSAGDRMVQMGGPCVHDNAWKRARRPDQAKLGIVAIAHSKPRRLEHCERCTGGGFWRAWFD